jgi:hypothetical protein
MPDQNRTDALKQQLQQFKSDPVETTKQLSHEYGLDKQEFSKIVIITCTALLVVSINSVYTMQSVQSDLEQTDKDMQEASAVINSNRFQDAMDTLQRIESTRLTSQIQAAQTSFEQLDSSFDKIQTAQGKVDEAQRTYQWMSLISILGIISGVALRFM